MMNRKMNFLNRRNFLRVTAGMGIAVGLDSLIPVNARLLADTSQSENGREYPDVVRLQIRETQLEIAGRNATALTANGSLPGSLVRLREGQTATIQVTNHLQEDTSIHWHGLLLPAQMDGVPGLSFAGIKPGETFTYSFPVRQSGTYWYHSHSGLQKQRGHFGPLIIDPIEPDPFEYDRDYVVMLSDWTFENPHDVLANLKKMSAYYNYQRRTVANLFEDLPWRQMRMDPTDIADVTSATYTYLMNGMAPESNWTELFQPGEKVRLRFINASAMTFFDVRIPGLKMTVVQADGQNVQPVTVDEFRIAVAETYDVIVEPQEDTAYTIFAETMDRSGYARGTLASQLGMTAPIPERRTRPVRTMADMGMNHEMSGHEGGHSQHPMPGMNGDGQHQMSGHEGGHSQHPMPEMNGDGQHQMSGREGGHSQHPMPEMNGDGQHQMSGREGGHSQHSMPEMNGDGQHQMSGHEGGHSQHSMPEMNGDGQHQMSGMDGVMHGSDNHGRGNAGVPMMVRSRLHEPGIGLESTDNHRVLVYTDLRSLEPGYDRREPERELELHLTGNMERYMWSFDGKKYSESPTITFYNGERLRLTFVNDTMMEHPIHLHGMWMELDNGAGAYKPRKHVLNVKPAERCSVEVTVDAPGNWAFHCHLLYHMEVGMFRTVAVIDRPVGVNS